MTGEKPPLVAHIIYSLGTGGLENGLVNIINRTPPQRYRHVIICLTTAHEFSQRITAPNVRIIQLHKKEGNDLGMYWRLLRCLRQLRPAIIHSRNLAALDAQVLGLFLSGVKQVHGEHGRDIYDLDGSNWKYRQLRKFMRVFIDRYIAVSKDLEQWLLGSIGIRPDRLSQIYNGVDQSSFKPLEDKRSDILPAGFLRSPATIVLGTVGRLVEVKDQAMILKALDVLLREKPTLRDKLRVVIVGDGPLREQLLQLAEELKLSELVWMSGDRDDVPQLLQAMDIFLLPSLAEGVSNTVLEAMSTGLPVVATDTGGTPELIEQGVNGYLVPVGDFVALAASITSLLDAPDVLARMGEQALDCIHQRFDWDRTVEQYLKVYDGLLGITGVELKEGSNAAPLNKMEAE